MESLKLTYSVSFHSNDGNNSSTSDILSGLADAIGKNLRDILLARKDPFGRQHLRQEEKQQQLWPHPNLPTTTAGKAPFLQFQI
jgi:hypothetical protein